MSAVAAKCRAINAALQRQSVASLKAHVAIGKMFVALKRREGHGGFQSIFDNKQVACSQQVAERYMRIASFPPFTGAKSSILKNLPPEKTIQAKLTELTPKQFYKAIKDKRIHSEMSFVDADLLVSEIKRGKIVTNIRDSSTKHIVVPVKPTNLTPIAARTARPTEPKDNGDAETDEWARFENALETALAMIRSAFDQLDASSQDDALLAIREELTDVFPEIDLKPVVDDDDVEVPDAAVISKSNKLH